MSGNKNNKYSRDILYHLNIGEVKGLCSTKIYKRGLEYFHDKRVLKPIVDGDVLRAQVEGNDFHPYLVEIKIKNKNGNLISNCTCPFDFENFCKHSIALLISWIYKKEHFFDIDFFLDSLNRKSKQELLELIQNLVRLNPWLIIDQERKIPETLWKRLDNLFSNNVDYDQVPILVRELEKYRKEAEDLFEKHSSEAFNLIKILIDSSLRNYSNVDDSRGDLSTFIEDSLDLYGKVIRDLKEEEGAVRHQIHDYNWNMFVTDAFGFSDDISDMMINSCQTRDDFDYLENLANRELENRKRKLEMKKERDDYPVIEIVDFLLSLYQKRLGNDNNNDDDSDEHYSNHDHGGDTKFILLCEKEFQYCYSRYIDYLESKGELDKAILYCHRAFEFAKGFHGTRLTAKLGDLKYLQGEYKEALVYYIDAFTKDPTLRDMEVKRGKDKNLFTIIKILSSKLGEWKENKEKLISFLIDRRDYHGLIRIHLNERDLDSAYDIALKDRQNLHDMEKVANALEKTLPKKACQLYTSMAENLIEKANRNSYKYALHYYKKIKKIYVSLGLQKEFLEYIDNIKKQNIKKRALQEELAKL